MKAKSVCSECGQSFERLAILALMCDLGARASTPPDYCHAADDNKHNFVTVGGNTSKNEDR